MSDKSIQILSSEASRYVEESSEGLPAYYKKKVEKIAYAMVRVGKKPEGPLSLLNLLKCKVNGEYKEVIQCLDTIAGSNPEQVSSSISQLISLYTGKTGKEALEITDKLREYREQGKDICFKINSIMREHNDGTYSNTDRSAVGNRTPCLRKYSRGVGTERGRVVRRSAMY